MYLYTSVLTSCLPLPLLSSLYLCPHFLGGKGLMSGGGFRLNKHAFAPLVEGAGGWGGRGRGFGLTCWVKKGKRAGDLRQLPYGADFFSRLPHSINIRLIRRRSSSPPVNPSSVFRNEPQKRPTNRWQAVRKSQKTSVAVQLVGWSPWKGRALRFGAA